MARDIRALIRQMRSTNPLWGAPRMHGELRKLGIEVSETTVAKYVGRTLTAPNFTEDLTLPVAGSQKASIFAPGARSSMRGRLMPVVTASL